MEDKQPCGVATQCSIRTDSSAPNVLRSGFRKVWKLPGQRFSKYTSDCINEKGNPSRLTWESKQTAIQARKVFTLK